MEVYKLEMIPLQGMVYFEGKRVIIVEENAVYGFVLNSLGDSEKSGCFKSFLLVVGVKRSPCWK